MQAKLTKVSDTLTPDLAALYRVASNTGALHQAIGLGLVGITKRAFNDASMRPSSWPALSTGGPARLRKSGTLAKSIRVIASGRSGVTIGTDRKYAAIHQLGGKTKAHIIEPKHKKALRTPFGIFARVHHPGSRIPARPFLPFFASGKISPRGGELVQQVVRARLAARR